MTPDVAAAPSDALATAAKTRPFAVWLRLLRLLVIAGVTMLALPLGAELGLRRAMPWKAQDRCLTKAFTGRAGCTSGRIRFWAGPWVTYAYNACGARTAQPCGPPPPGASRVSVLGTSYAFGWYVPYDDLFSARAAAALQRDCRRAVEFQNFSISSAGVEHHPIWHTIIDRLPTALAVKPNLLLVMVTSGDLLSYEPKSAQPSQQQRARAEPDAITRVVSGVGGLLHQVDSYINGQSVTVMALRTLYYRDPRAYLAAYAPTPAAGFLRPGMPNGWRERIPIADRILGRIEAEAKAAGVPVTVVYVPNYGSSLAEAGRTRGLDPEALPMAFKEIVERHGARFVDLTPFMGSQPALYRDYYTSIDHPSPEGSRLIGAAVAESLEREAGPFAACMGSAR